MKAPRRWMLWLLALCVLPLLLQQVGNGWVRIADTALLYVLLAVGLNIVVGYAGLLDLGYVAFFAVGAYLYALLASPHLMETFEWLAVMLPGGLHTPLWLVIRVFLNNLDQPVNLTNGPKGLGTIDPVTVFGHPLSRRLDLGFVELPSVTLYYYLFLLLVVVAVVFSHRLETSRIGRAWMAIREDEVAARAMGIHTRDLKLLAFAMGASFGGVAGAMFAAFQGFISPESFSLMESVMIVAMVVLGGLGHLPGVILGAVLLSALPEVLRYTVGPLMALTDGRLDPAILRQLLIALAMILVMLWRPRGLWPSPEHGSPAASPSKGAGA